MHACMHGWMDGWNECKWNEWNEWNEGNEGNDAMIRTNGMNGMNAMNAMNAVLSPPGDNSSYGTTISYWLPCKNQSVYKTFRS